MTLAQELTAVELVDKLHAFWVEPVKARRGYYDSKESYTWISDRVETIEEAARLNGKIIEFYPDGNALIEQDSNRVEQEGHIVQSDKPIKWLMKVSKTKLKVHVPSLDKPN